jgi:hypothetical protein
MQAVVLIRLQRGARGVLDRHQPVPRIVDELPAGLVHGPGATSLNMLGLTRGVGQSLVQ